MAEAGTTLKLYYFNMKGRAEHIRYLFAVADMVYDDHRVSSGWQTLKPNTPFGAMPFLEVTTAGKTQQIGSSVGVARFVARITGLYASTALDQAHIDGIVDCANDIREDAISMFIFKKDNERKEGLEKYLEKTNAKLANLDKLYAKPCSEMAKNQAKRDCKVFFMGDKITWADIHFYHVIETVQGAEQGLDLLQKFPKLQTLYNNVGSHPKIVSWQKRRPKTDN